jgi:hypothetical protein
MNDKQGVKGALLVGGVVTLISVGLAGSLSFSNYRIQKQDEYRLMKTEAQVKQLEAKTTPSVTASPSASVSRSATVTTTPTKAVFFRSTTPVVTSGVLRK